MPKNESNNTYELPNGRLKAKISDHVGVTREDMIKKFKSEHDETPFKLKTRFEEMTSWAKKNPKTSAALGASMLFLLGPKKLTKLTKLGVSTGIFSHFYSKWKGADS